MSGPTVGAVLSGSSAGIGTTLMGFSLLSHWQGWAIITLCFVSYTLGRVFS